MRIVYSWLSLLTVLVLAIAVVPLHFSADVFSLLPKGAATVEGLKRYQQSFGSSEAVILAISIEGGEENQSERLLAAMPVLAKAFEKTALVSSAIWQSPFAGNQTALSELIAYQWLNQNGSSFTQMAARFKEEQIDTHLNEVLERIATSFNAGEVARLANDPFSLTQVVEKIANQGQDPFVSSDELLRVMFLNQPPSSSTVGDSATYWDYSAWLQALKTEISSLRNSGEIDENIKIEFTGNPVFVVEFGSQLLRDLSLAALGTLIVVMLLFWWAHRRIKPLVALAATLVLSLGITIIAGMIIFGKLNAVSLGFAAILLGLAVDYGLITYQEYRSNPRRSLGRIRRTLAPSILWAAVTTAAAFLMIARSSLPGLAELGTLVAIGIVVSALLVLFVYLPTIHNHQPNSDTATHVSQRNFQLSSKTAWTVTIALAIGALMILSLIHPRIETDVSKLRFADSEARRAHEKVQTEISGDNSQLWLIVEGKDENQVRERLTTMDSVLQSAVASGMPLAVTTPTAFWPNVDYQHKNLSLAQELVAEKGRIYTQVESAGFTSDSLQLTDAVFGTWSDLPGNNNAEAIWPSSPELKWLFDQFVSNGGDSLYALAKIGTHDELSRKHLDELSNNISQVEGVQLVGWSLLADELAVTMVEDAVRVFIPMAAVLIILLALTFRDPRDMLLSFISLTFSLGLLATMMSLLGMSWNILNLMALPLLFGAGVDYSIHIQLALKRFQGDLSQMFRSVGAAILLCGASTCVAFASLGFTSNAGIASLGQVTALGIAISSCVAVFLLPVWWRYVHRIPSATVAGA